MNRKSHTAFVLLILVVLSSAIFKLGLSSSDNSSNQLEQIQEVNQDIDTSMFTYWERNYKTNSEINVINNASGIFFKFIHSNSGEVSLLSKKDSNYILLYINAQLYRIDIQHHLMEFAIREYTGIDYFNLLFSNSQFVESLVEFDDSLDYTCPKNLNCFEYTNLAEVNILKFDLKQSIFSGVTRFTNNVMTLESEVKFSSAKDINSDILQNFLKEEGASLLNAIEVKELLERNNLIEVLDYLPISQMGNI
ncbi:MAG: hypothetical protein Kow0081_2620 [Candidatus Dojkabacteria bacterium]